MLELVPLGFEEVEERDRLELAAYVDAAGEERLRAAFGAAEAAPVPPGWAERWRSFHRPVRAGGLWIGPPWETPAIGEPSITIEPGRAFGTGAHPTSRLCIDLLAGIERGSLVDVGCGSGVLALAGARLGFGPVTAVDVDPIAVEVARANARANGVELDVFVLDALAESPPAADVIVANLSLGAVQTLLARLASGVVVTSGYLVHEQPKAGGWCSTTQQQLGGWAADVFRRPESRLQPSLRQD